MVWAALLYAVSRLARLLALGRPLVRLGADRYAREADFRAALVQGVGARRGHRAQQRRGRQRGAGSRRASTRSSRVLRQIAFARARLTWVTAGYGWVALVFPIIVAAPGYFAGRLTFGELMMVVGAFNQVQQSLRWFVDNTGTIADWRAALLRVMNFRQALLELDAVEAGAGLIERARGRRTAASPSTTCGSRPGTAASRSTRRGSRSRRASACSSSAAPARGARASSWRSPGSGAPGSGRIGVPPDGEVAYLTQRPFLPGHAARARCRATASGDGRATTRAARSARRWSGCGARQPRRQPRPRRALGPRARPRRAGAARLRAAAPRPAEVAGLRRGPRPARRRQPPRCSSDPERGARGERGRQRLAAPGADRLLRPGGRACGLRRPGGVGRPTAPGTDPVLRRSGKRGRPAGRPHLRSRSSASQLVPPADPPSAGDESRDVAGSSFGSRSKMSSGVNSPEKAKRGGPEDPLAPSAARAHRAVRSERIGAPAAAPSSRQSAGGAERPAAAGRARGGEHQFGLRRRVGA